MAKNTGEPSLTKIDDYNGNETKQKRNTVRLIIVLLLVLGAIFAYLQQPAQKTAVEVEQKTQIPMR